MIEKYELIAKKMGTPWSKEMEKILTTLLENPRTSFREIAKKCQMPTNAIRMRFRRLKNTGVITGSIMQINPHNIGYGCNGHIFIQTDFNDENLFSHLEKTPNIFGAGGREDF